MAATGHSNFFLWAQKLKVRNYSNFTITFPTIWRCARDFFKVLLKFKIAATNQLYFFVGAKTQKNSLVIFFICYHLATWGCATDF